MNTPEFNSILRRFFNGNVVTVTRMQYKYILGHFHTPAEDIYIISENESGLNIQLW